MINTLKIKEAKARREEKKEEKKKKQTRLMCCTKGLSEKC